MGKNKYINRQYDTSIIFEIDKNFKIMLAESLINKDKDNITMTDMGELIKVMN